MAKKIDREKLKRLYKQGLSRGEIAYELGCSKNHIDRIVRELKQRGEFPSDSPLDTGKVKALRYAGWDDEMISREMHRTIEEIQSVEGCDYDALHW